MNINHTIYSGLEDHIKAFYDYCSSDISTFMQKRLGHKKRQILAINIIRKILSTHGKERLLEHLAKLAEVEQGIQTLQPWERDHVVHALLSFMLGIYINFDFLYESFDLSVDPFEWKLAGMLHDIGYPAEIAKDILVPYSNTMNNIANNIGTETEDVYFKITPVNYEKLTNNINSLDLIQNKLNKWELFIDARVEYENNINSGKICDGMLSALSVLRTIDLMYQKNNPNRKHEVVVADNFNFNQDIFENEIVSACSAIFIHNLPARCFAQKKIDREKAPTAFLLKLADSLQDWERPSAKLPNGFPGKYYSIITRNKNLILNVKGLPDRQKKIEDEIRSALIADDIIIQ